MIREHGGILIVGNQQMTSSVQKDNAFTWRRQNLRVLSVTLVQLHRDLLDILAFHDVMLATGFPESSIGITLTAR